MNLKKIINELETCIYLLESEEYEMESSELVNRLIQTKDGMIRIFSFFANLLDGIEETEREENTSSLGGIIERLENTILLADEYEKLNGRKVTIADEIFDMVSDIKNIARHVSENVFKNEYQKDDCKIAI